MAGVFLHFTSIPEGSKEGVGRQSQIHYPSLIMTEAALRIDQLGLVTGTGDFVNVLISNNINGHASEKRFARGITVGDLKVRKVTCIYTRSMNYELRTKRNTLYGTLHIQILTFL